MFLLREAFLLVQQSKWVWTCCWPNSTIKKCYWWHILIGMAGSGCTGIMWKNAWWNMQHACFSMTRLATYIEDIYEQLSIHYDKCHFLLTHWHLEVGAIISSHSGLNKMDISIKTTFSNPFSLNENVWIFNKISLYVPSLVSIVIGSWNGLVL